MAIPLLLILDTFKSPSFTSLPFLPRSMLAHLISLWKMLSLCSAFMPCSNCSAILQISSSLILSFRFWWLLTKALRSPPLANSVISSKQPDSQSYSASLQPMIYGLLMLASILTSLRQLLISLGELFTILIFFIAQTPPSTFRVTLQTEAKAPSPILPIISKLFMPVKQEYRKKSRSVDYQNQVICSILCVR